MKQTVLTQEQMETLVIEAEYDPKRLAQLAGISVRQLQRIFRLRYGQSPQKWLDRQRIQAAERLLRQGKSVKFIAMELGYKQASHFCRQFKLFKGLRPSQFAMLTVAPERINPQITYAAARHYNPQAQPRTG